MLFGGFDLAGVLAQFRRNPVELEGVVDVFFGLAGDPFFVIDSAQAIFVQRESHLQRPLAEGDTVALGAGEILQSGSVGIWRQGADVDLQSRCAA